MEIGRPQVFSLKGYINPEKGLKIFYNAVRTLGYKRVLKDKKFKKLRELWKASLFSYGISKLRKRPSLLKIIDKDPPDAEVILKIDELKNRYISAEVEIFDIEAHTKVTGGESDRYIASRIKSKIANKKYPKSYILLAFLDKRLKITPVEIYKEIKKFSPPFDEIWLLVLIDKDKLGYRLYKVWRESDFVEFNLG